MTSAKVDIKIGALSFAGEGDKEWLAKQLDKVIQRAPELLQLQPAGSEEEHHSHKPANPGKVGTLASFLSAKNAKNSQPIKFLATAAWLHAKGTKRLSTGDVTKALDDNNQGKLANASDCLAKNVKKGHCERSGSRQFYVTEEGLKSLG